MNLRHFAALATLVAALFVPSFASAQPFRRHAPVAVVVAPQYAPRYAPQYAPQVAPRYAAPRYAPQYAPRYAPQYAPRYAAPRHNGWGGRRWGR